MRLLIIALLVACGAPEARQTPPPDPAPSVSGQPAVSAQPAVPAQPAESVEAVATRLGKAALAGERATAVSLTLTFEEIATIAKKAAESDKAAWDDEVNGFFDRLEREGRENAGKLDVVGAKVLEAGSLKSSESTKLLRDIDYAVVQLVFEDNGASSPKGPPMFFVRTEAGWRFSPKK